MRSLFLTAAALALAASPALAATHTAAGPEMNQSGTSSESAGTTAHMGSHGNQAIQQKIHKELSQAGFTDIQVAPESFLVHAKDSSGNPVVMAITPNSVTAVTAMSGHPGQSPEAGHSAGNTGSTGAMGSSPMTNSEHAGSAGNGTSGTVR